MLVSPFFDLINQIINLVFSWLYFNIRVKQPSRTNKLLRDAMSFAITTEILRLREYAPLRMTVLARLRLLQARGRIL